MVLKAQNFQFSTNVALAYNFSLREVQNIALNEKGQ